MTHWAVCALVLIRVDRAAGRWCSLRDLAAGVCVPAEKLQPICDTLAAEQLLQRTSLDGVPHYGVQIGGAPICHATQAEAVR